MRGWSTMWLSWTRSGYHWLVSAPRKPYQRSNPRPIGQFRRVEARFISSFGQRCHLPTMPCSTPLAEHLGQHPVLGGIVPLPFGNPIAASVMHAMLLRCGCARSGGTSGSGSTRGGVPLREPHAVPRRCGRCSASRSARRSSSSREKPTSSSTMYNTFGVPSRAFGVPERSPVRLRVADIHVDRTPEWPAHRRTSLAADAPTMFSVGYHGITWGGDATGAPQTLRKRWPSRVLMLTTLQPSPRPARARARHRRCSRTPARSRRGERADARSACSGAG